jgi:hypothetical protein
MFTATSCDLTTAEQQCLRRHGVLSVRWGYRAASIPNFEDAMLESPCYYWLSSFGDPLFRVISQSCEGRAFVPPGDVYEKLRRASRSNIDYYPEAAVPAAVALVRKFLADGEMRLHMTVLAGHVRDAGATCGFRGVAVAAQCLLYIEEGKTDRAQELAKEFIDMFVEQE